jgi:hypothetical protein
MAGDDLRSLSADCTPLKHRYDSCFNSWFEGYLQPALDASRSSFSYESGSHVSTSSSSSGSSSPTESASPSSADPPRRQYLITSWASAFRQRPRHQEPRDLPYEDPLDSPQKDTTVIPSGPTKAVDTAGKTRAQIKAEDYERACGESWRTYQKCLKVSSSCRRIRFCCV